MFRRLSFLRGIAVPEKTRFLSRLWKNPVLLTCLSSGLLYRSYWTLPQNPASKTNTPTLQTCMRTPSKAQSFFVCVESGIGGDNPTDARRLQRLADLRQSVENELSQFFMRNLFEIPSGFLDRGTIVSVERPNGMVHIFKNHTFINTMLVMTRGFSKYRSSSCRIELLGLMSDPEKWELEASFRVVLVPTPSLRDARLPQDVLWQKMESRARWHEFRVTFAVSEIGEVSQIHITKFMPPQQPPLRNLKQLAFLRRLAPALPGVRRLPSPTPFVLPIGEDSVLFMNELLSSEEPPTPDELFKQLSLTPNTSYPVINQLSALSHGDLSFTPLSLSALNSTSPFIHTSPAFSNLSDIFLFSFLRNSSIACVVQPLPQTNSSFFYKTRQKKNKESSHIIFHSNTPSSKSCTFTSSSILPKLIQEFPVANLLCPTLSIPT